MKIGNRELLHWIIGAAIVWALYEYFMPSDAQTTPGPYSVPGGIAGSGAIPGVPATAPPGGSGNTTYNSYPGGTTLTSNVYGYPIPGFPPPTSMYQLFQGSNINQTFWGPGGNPNYFPLFGFVGVDTSQSFQ